jgi:hypothetical protein
LPNKKRDAFTGFKNCVPSFKTAQKVCTQDINVNPAQVLIVFFKGKLQFLKNIFSVCSYEFKQIDLKKIPTFLRSPENKETKINIFVNFKILFINYELI